jgi:hypothetical protein
MLQTFWKSMVALLTMGWVLLIHPFWPAGVQPGPISQWQSFNTFNSQQICESYRKLFIAEQQGNAQQHLKTLSICVPETAVH